MRHDGGEERFFVVMVEQVVVVVVHGGEREGWVEWGNFLLLKVGPTFSKIILIWIKGYFRIFHLLSGQNESFLLFSGQNETVYCL